MAAGVLENYLYEELFTLVSPQTTTDIVRLLRHRSALGLKWAIVLLHYINVYADLDADMERKFPPLLEDPLLVADSSKNASA